MIRQLLFSLAVVASASAQTAADGYKFRGNPPPLRLEFGTVVVEHDSSAKLADSIRQYGINSTEVHAFSVYDPNTNICTIHIVKPARIYMPEHMGHELMHCVYGKWHK